MTESAIIFERSLPEGFGFYNLGEVRELPLDGPAAPEPGGEAAERDAFVFRLSGELSGFVAVAFDCGLDPSACSEIGNIIAGKFASNLRSRHGIEVMISPPIKTSSRQAEAAAAILKHDSITRKKYCHFHNGTIIRMDALVAATPARSSRDA
ncbi:MAG: hypothetical protein A2583_00585 [Bdellovibrionales bacterium RIFOXYD1_FULL_53_11]|nr:MAG: hypothetical protein A2583_00585 [Bdellovibrionales bacterium RIFOXYD1_FULL_53_11]